MNTYYNFNPYSAVFTNGADRQALNSHLENTLWAIGLATNISTWSINKAVALAHTVGANVNSFHPLTKVGTRWIGVVGLVIDSRQLYIGLGDGFQWNEDGWNAAQVALGLVGLAAFFAASPWVAVGVGLIQLSIAVGQQINED